jgi:hypothetical protein
LQFEESIHEASFLKPIYGDETKMKTVVDSVVETSELFFLSSITANKQPLSVEKVKNYTPY